MLSEQYYQSTAKNNRFEWNLYVIVKKMPVQKILYKPGIQKVILISYFKLKTILSELS